MMLGLNILICKMGLMMLGRTQYQTHSPLHGSFPKTEPQEKEARKQIPSCLSVNPSAMVASVFIEEGNLQSSQKNISSVTPAAQLFSFRKSAEG